MICPCPIALPACLPPRAFPELLSVEITEQTAMSDITKANDILTRLRLKDISVSLDDFGSGYSSLVEIYRLPLSELQFDRSLAIELDQCEDTRTVMRALIALAHLLELPLCVEGVETAATLAFLQSIQCDLVQGYFISTPLSADEFVKFVDRWTGQTIPGCDQQLRANDSAVVQLQ